MTKLDLLFERFWATIEARKQSKLPISSPSSSPQTTHPLQSTLPSKHPGGPPNHRALLPPWQRTKEHGTGHLSSPDAEPATELGLLQAQRSGTLSLLPSQNGGSSTSMDLGTSEEGSRCMLPHYTHLPARCLSVQQSLLKLGIG
ncbi:Hypothetical predicted protein [Pelobates cultripes]|uniref:Uncharacterized protein n=1 Tax=Pelobates cultripes TaxID=61616 RepID=A0AAD1WCG6_PELCU|nr:Hypothetical predicted protein [Pelobates cultripes]